MCQFVKNDVVETLDIFFSKLQIKPDRLALRSAAAPFRFHALDEEPIDFDIQVALPRFYPR